MLSADVIKDHEWEDYAGLSGYAVLLINQRGRPECPVVKLEDAGSEDRRVYITGQKCRQPLDTRNGKGLGFFLRASKTFILAPVRPISDF